MKALNKRRRVSINFKYIHDFNNNINESIK